MLLDGGLGFRCLFTLKTLQYKGPFGIESEKERENMKIWVPGAHWLYGRMKRAGARSGLTLPLPFQSPFSLPHLIFEEWIPRKKSEN